MFFFFQDLLDWKTVELLDNVKARRDPAKKLSFKLYDLAGKCQVCPFPPTHPPPFPRPLLLFRSFHSPTPLPPKGMSGRTLRRLPVLAHARYVAAHMVPEVGAKATRLATWLRAMERVVEEEKGAMRSVKEGGETTVL